MTKKPWCLTSCWVWEEEEDHQKHLHTYYGFTNNGWDVKYQYLSTNKKVVVNFVQSCNERKISRTDIHTEVKKFLFNLEQGGYQC